MRGKFAFTHKEGYKFTFICILYMYRKQVLNLRHNGHKSQNNKKHTWK